MANENKITVNSALIPNTTNTPLDARIRVSTLNDIEKIQLPYIGMVFYVEDQKELFIVKSLKSKFVMGREIPNMVVDSYERVVKPEIEEAINDILAGIKQQEILNLKDGDEGKILSVIEDAKSNLVVQAIDNGAESVKYQSNSTEANITSVKEALDYLMQNIKNTTVDTVAWENIINKPKLADGLMVTDNVLSLRTGNENMSTVELPKGANKISIESDKISLRYIDSDSDDELSSIPLTVDSDITAIIDDLDK